MMNLLMFIGSFLSPPISLYFPILSFISNTLIYFQCNSYGVVLWEVLSKKPPYEGMEANIIIGKVAYQKPSYRPPIPANVPKPLLDLMIRCWDDEPRNRPAFGDIINYLTPVYNSLPN